MIPRATYRLQFHKDFPFAEGAALAGYLADLGVSHVYASPILTARPGSRHGYDVVDHGRINPELGGEAGFRDMAAALKVHGLGIILDIVPNHMAVGKGNGWWQDVLARGRASPWAAAFDIDWDALYGKLLAPFLDGDPVMLLRRGDLKLVRDEQGWCFRYFDHRFPLRPEDASRLEDGAALSPPELEVLLVRQHYVLADWREADARINWRRFFDITDLAAIRIEEPRVFEAAHAMVFALYGEGLIDGVRIDHVDGLADPAAYCRLLRARLSALGREPWLIVEKILAADETLPRDWGCDGTTGYDFMNEAGALLHEADAAPALDRLWARYGGRGRDFAQEESLARREILASKFPAQLAATARAFARALPHVPQAVLEAAIREIIIALNCYRDYATGKTDSPGAGPHLRRAVAAAIAARPDLAGATGDVAALFSSRAGDPLVMDALRRFHQLSAPVAAKAVEDTALYRYGRLLSRNEVGSDPGMLAMKPAEFHARMAARVLDAPAAMLTTATHDHKRGEDMRARLAALCAAPATWRDFVAGVAMPEGLHPGDVYQLLQTLIGAWPDDAPDEAFTARIAGWCEKFLREAKLRSSWAAPDTLYEQSLRDFARRLILAPEADTFRRRLEALLADIRSRAETNTLIQTVLRYTVPGVPDLYQGCEFCDLSLVDPDNRRPVDFAARIQSLGRPCVNRKQQVIAALLAARRADPDLWRLGDYAPLDPGVDKAGAIGFTRTHGAAWLIVLVRCDPAASSQAILHLEQAACDLLTGRHFAKGNYRWADLLGALPAAVLKMEADTAKTDPARMATP